MPEFRPSFANETRPLEEGLQSAVRDLRHGEPGAAEALRRFARSIGHTAEKHGMADLRAKAGEVMAVAPDGLPGEGAALLDLLRSHLGQEKSREVTLLLVEDDPDMVRLLTRVLSGEGRSILTASDRTGMQRFLAERTVDLILLDLFLPDADGRDLLLEIRENPATGDIPVVVCSALPAAEGRAESLALGADDYLEKPIVPDLVRTVVARALRSASSEGRGPSSPPSASRPHDAGAGEARTGGGVRVLLVEDDQLSAALVQHRLIKEGHEVVWIEDGREAYSVLQDSRFDLIILDVKLPGMDGLELLERLRKLPRLASVPVIMLTAMGREEDVVRGFDLGADDYVLKPFSPMELAARVQRLVRA